MNNTVVGKIEEPKEFVLAFHDDSGAIIGKLIIKDSTLIFDGDAEPSAEIFFEFVMREFEIWQKRHG